VDLELVDINKDGLWEKLVGMEPDILVNNATIYSLKRFTDVDGR